MNITSAWVVFRSLGWLAILGLAAGKAAAQASAPATAPATQPADAQKEKAFDGLKARCIGPAFMSGRISDIAVNPEHNSEYYLGVASGGVWKTLNNGITWSPVFDKQGSYSIGCVTIDPRNPHTVWVGTGENNSQRSVGFGDGVYRSFDGGQNWENLGLKTSEHIGRIVIHPHNSDIVYVAAQGPLWRSGGERGLYKTIDGGKTWERSLYISEDTGVNEAFLDPRHPDVVYASAYQRRRHVWTVIDGGPESGLYKSTDAGQSWRKINKGLPEEDKGRIGLAVSPVNPDVLYASVESIAGKSGFFRSTDRGESWQKRSDFICSVPQYFNEIVCDPQEIERVYAFDVALRVTDDAGKTFHEIGTRDKHVDNHTMWIDPADNQHLRVGCDGGLYESYDRGENWAFIENLPVTQFYRISTDTVAPFYNVYGGTQDNSSEGGPSRTTDQAGITSGDWFITVGGDGYETLADSGDPMILYCLWQYGMLVRHDRRSGEITDIKPREAPGELPLKWNWDSPLIQSPHAAGRLYFAANRLFRSDDRGDSWKAISGDLTRGIDRSTLPVMGRIQSVDAVARNKSTSFYGNCTALCESPVKEGLLWTGTDDGLIHVTTDGGKNWRKLETFPGVPAQTYVSGLTASRHDANTIYATFDNHKNGDFKPYLLKSTNLGESWVSVAGDLPERETVYCLQEDGVRADLLFAGTEFAARFTLDGGQHWNKLNGVPPIPVRDIDIQRRENDLVVGTFGRGIYILDDYSPLRQMAPEVAAAPARLFAVKDALRYVERTRLGGRNGRGSQGATYYAAENPPFGAVFTYSLKDKITSRREQRREAEKKLRAASQPIRIPDMDELKEEDRELEPQVFVVVRDDQDQIVKRVRADRDAGLHRVAWDLHYPSSEPVRTKAADPDDPDEPDDSADGPLALPGTYSATIVKAMDGQESVLAGPVAFNVVPLELATFAAKDKATAFAFQRKVARLQRAVEGAVRVGEESRDHLKQIRAALLETPAADAAMIQRTEALSVRLQKLLADLRGDPVYGKYEEPGPLSIKTRVQAIVGSQWRVTAMPTQNDRHGYDQAADSFTTTLADLRTLLERDLKTLEGQLETIGAPWTPGRIPVWSKETTP